MAAVTVGATLGFLGDYRPHRHAREVFCDSVTLGEHDMMVLRDAADLPVAYVTVARIDDHADGNGEVRFDSAGIGATYDVASVPRGLKITTDSEQGTAVHYLERTFQGGVVRVRYGNGCSVA